jgi:hypothetical protein
MKLALLCHLVVLLDLSAAARLASFILQQPLGRGKDHAFLCAGWGCRQQYRSR